MMTTSKISEHHLSREACVYIRQSTVGQVRFHQESTERQYDLASKARSLGWRPEQIRVVDRDLSQSGSQATHREDFKTLVGNVAMEKLGASSRWKPRAWRARTRIGIASWNRVPSLGPW
ncbi:MULTISPECIES: hypothetical protein [Mesorhizobium]|uniref:hypothetical protein n=1 Tax=Mesorhizobium TaxID=68287 RepID=UPI000800A8F9|nr:MULTISPECIES: hypothetical protein [Mesorhizobium]OBQ95796.1 hypothetical protein A9K66_24580 [Mesorhizobium sp. AA23]